MVNDPCDEMVTIADVTHLVSREFWLPEEKRNDPYGRAAAILGVSRGEAKINIYRYAFGMRSSVEAQNGR